jgi:hypothetical protein
MSDQILRVLVGKLGECEDTDSIEALLDDWTNPIDEL